MKIQYLAEGKFSYPKLGLIGVKQNGQIDKLGLVVGRACLAWFRVPLTLQLSWDLRRASKDFPYLPVWMKIAVSIARPRFNFNVDK